MSSRVHMGTEEHWARGQGRRQPRFGKGETKASQVSLRLLPLFPCPGYLSPAPVLPPGCRKATAEGGRGEEGAGVARARMSSGGGEGSSSSWCRGLASHSSSPSKCPEPGLGPQAASAGQDE